MITIELDSGYLDLGPDTEIVWVEKNNALELGSVTSLPGTADFELPWTPGNAAKLLHIEQAHNHNNVTSFACKCSFGNVLNFEGNLNVLQTVRGKKFTVNISLNLEEFNTKKKLSSFEYGGVRNHQDGDDYVLDDDPDDVVQGGYPQFDFTYFPIFYDTVFSPPYMMPYVPGSGFGALDDRTYPQPFLMYILRQIFSSFGYKIDGEWVRDEEIQQLVCLNIRFIRTFTSGPPFITFTEDLDLKNHVPDITVGQLLTSLKQRFLLGYYWRTNQRELVIRSLKNTLDSDEAQDLTDLVVGEEDTNFNKNAESYRMSQQFDQDDANERWLERPDPKFIKGTIAGSAIPPAVPGGAAEGDYYLYLYDNYYYRYNGSTMDKSAYNYFDIENDGSTINFNIDHDTPFMRNAVATGLAASKWKTPHVEYDVKYIEEGALLEMPLRLLYWRGLQEDSVGDTYPLASNDKTDEGGDPIGNYGLKNEDQYADWQANYFELKANPRAVYFKFKPDPRIFNMWEPWKRQRVGNQHYVWDTRETLFRMRGIGPTKMLMVRV
jgi:hypothetical protein